MEVASELGAPVFSWEQPLAFRLVTGGKDEGTDAGTRGVLYAPTLIPHSMSTKNRCTKKTESHPLRMNSLMAE